MQEIYTPSEYLELCTGLLVLFFTATWCVLISSLILVPTLGGPATIAALWQQVCAMSLV
jgi:hypothetical protein